MRAPFGFYKISFLDWFGTWLSKRAIKKFIKKRKNLNVLELGCGFKAKNLLAIQENAKLIYALDYKISSDLKKNYKFKILEGAIENSLKKLKKVNFDLILIISVLEHLKNPGQTLYECRKLLNKDGVLLINVPTWTGKIFLEFSAFKLGLSPKEEMDDHKIYYNKKDLWPLLVKSGFKPSLIKLKYHKFYLNLFASAKK